MRVVIVSCSYLLYEYLLKLKKCPRPRPQEFGLDQHHWCLAKEQCIAVDRRCARAGVVRRLQFICR